MHIPATLKGPIFAIIGIIFVLLFNVKHSAEVYTFITETQVIAFSKTHLYIILMMVAIDLAVVIFTVHGNRSASIVFAIGTSLMKLFYFYTAIGLPNGDLETLMKYIPAGLLSAGFGFAIYYFNEIFVKNMEDDQLLETYRLERNHWQEKFSALNSQFNVLQKRVGEGDSKLQQELDEALTIQEDLLTYIVRHGNFAETKLDTLRKRKQRARQALNNGASPEDKNLARIQILAIDHYAAMQKKRPQKEVVLHKN